MSDLENIFRAVDGPRPWEGDTPAYLPAARVPAKCVRAAGWWEYVDVCDRRHVWRYRRRAGTAEDFALQCEWDA